MAPIQQPSRARAELARARDAALRRISHARRWAFVAAAALSAGLAALASALLPGKSFGARSRTAAPPSTSARYSSATPPLPAPANAAQLGITGSASSSQASPSPAPAPQAQAAPAPAAPQPQPAPAPAPSGGAVVVSGGS